MLFLINSYAPAQRIVIDWECIRQVATNATVAVGSESVMSAYTGESKNKQDKTAIAVGAIQTSVSLYQLALSNVTYWGNDSKNIIEIGNLARKVGAELSKVTDEVQKNPMATIVSYRAIEGITAEALQCVKFCYSLVTNGKVAIAGFSVGPDNDGYNFLDAKDRMDVCNHIIVTLRRLYYSCISIRIQYMYTNTWADVLKKAMPFEYYMVTSGNEIAKEIIGSLK